MSPLKPSEKTYEELVELLAFESFGIKTLSDSGMLPLP